MFKLYVTLVTKLQRPESYTGTVTKDQFWGFLKN